MANVSELKNYEKRLVVALSKRQQEYQDFFRGQLEEAGVKSPKELSKEERSTFFKGVSKGWSKKKKK